MRIVTLNTWKNEGDYPRRLQLMSRGLSALMADVVCLQETFAGAGCDTAGRLAADLHLRLHPAPAREKPRTHAGRIVASTSGLAILTRVPAHARTLPLPEDAADGERIAQVADLVACGRPLRILNLHLTHLRGSAASRLREAQLRAALDWAQADLTGALVIAGDLNAEAGAPELARLALPAAPSTLQAPRRADNAAAAGQVGAAIDHCALVRPGAWRVQSRQTALDLADRDGVRPSDHKAVVLNLAPA